MVRERDLQAEWLYQARVKQGGGEKVARTSGRKRAIWTQAQMSAWLREHGVPVDDATYRQWESGYRPVTAEYLRLLEPLLGAMPEEPKPAANDSDGSLAAALTALTAELAHWREEREGYRRRIADLEVTVARLAAGALGVPGNADKPAPAPPPGSAE